MSRVARVVDSGRVRSVWTWCPGCDSLHPFRVSSVDPFLVTWAWDGDLEAPTFSPSLLCTWAVHLCEGEHDPLPCEDPDCSQPSHTVGYVVDGALQWRFPDGIPVGPDDALGRTLGHAQPHTREPAYGPCHSFLRGGRWEFLSDSAHHLAGQTVDMVPLPHPWSQED